MRLQVFARVDGGIFRYESRGYLFVPAGELAAKLFAPRDHQLWLIDELTGTARSSNPSGPATFVDLVGEPGRLGMVISFEADGQPSLRMPLTFWLGSEARDSIRQLSRNWIHHLHIVHTGVLTHTPRSRQLVQLDLVQQQARDIEGIPSVLKLALASPSTAIPSDLARHSALALKNFWTSLALEILNPLEAPVRSGIESEAPPSGMERLIRHVVNCNHCCGGFACDDLKQIVTHCAGEGRLWKRLREQIALPVPAEPGSPLTAAPRLQVQINGVVYGSTAPFLAWRRLAVSADPTSTLLRLWLAEGAPEVLTVDGMPVVTFLKRDERRISLLFTFESGAGRKYYVPLALPLDVEGSIDADRPGQHVQRRVDGEFVTVSDSDELHWRILQSGDLEPGKVAEAVHEALCPGRLAEWSADLVHQRLGWYIEGLGARLLGVTGPHKPMWLRPPPTGVELRAIEHIAVCADAQAGGLCAECRTLADPSHADPTGGEILSALRWRLSYDEVVEHVAVLLKSSNAAPVEREDAIEWLLQIPTNLLVGALPTLSARWSPASSSREGAPFSALAWVKLAGRKKPQATPDSGPAHVERDSIVNAGWSTTDADRVVRLFTSRSQKLDDAELLLAAIALAETGSRHKDEIAPQLVQRIWLLGDRWPNPATVRLIEATAARLLRFALESEAARKVPTSPQVAEKQARALWPALESMPAGKRVTRNQLLEAFSRFPWLQRLIHEHVRATDPLCPVMDAFASPMPLPPSHRLRVLASADASNNQAMDEALLLLTWSWAALRSLPSMHEVPLPTADESTIAGSQEYWRQFLWGASAIAPSLAAGMWPDLIAVMLTRQLPPNVENQGWLSVANSIAQHRWACDEIVRAARVRMDALLQGPVELQHDQRLTSLLRLLSVADTDTHAFASRWCALETIATSSGIQGQAQRCMNFLLRRTDLPSLIAEPSVQSRLFAALAHADPYVAGTSVQVLLEGHGIRSSVRWMFHKALFRFFWSVNSYYWRALIAEGGHLGSLTTELLVDIGLARVPGLPDPSVSRLEALRSLQILDPQKAESVALLLIKRQQFELVLPWFRDLAERQRPGDELIDALTREMINAGGQTMGYAIGILRDAESRSIAWVGDKWSQIAAALAEELERVTSAESAMWLLVGLSELPTEHKPNLDRFVPIVVRLMRYVSIDGRTPKPLAQFLAALSDVKTEVLAAEPNQDLADYVAKVIERVRSEACPAYLVAVAREILGPLTQDSTRGALILALAGADATRVSAAVLQLLAASLRRDLPPGLPHQDFNNALGQFRSICLACRQRIDLELALMSAELDIQLDDLLGQGSMARLGLRHPLVVAINNWPVAADGHFTTLWKIGRLLGVRAAITYADGLAHDAAKVVDDTDETHAWLERALQRRFSSNSRRHDQPWEEALDIVTRIIHERAWVDVKVETVPPSIREGARLRLGTRFDSDDVATILDNLISNARHHGEGDVIVTVLDNRIEVSNIAPRDFSSEQAKALESCLKHRGQEHVRVGTGLQTIRRCLARNPMIRVVYRVTDVSDDSLTDDDRRADSCVVAALTWQPPRLADLAR